MSCPDEDTMLAFAEGELSGAAAVSVEEHLDQCAACRKLVSALARASLASARRQAAPGEAGASTILGVTSHERRSALEPGVRLAGRYRVQRLLGSGAMGAVYEVLDEQLGERVALKLLRPEVQSEPLLERLRQEIVLGRRITHHGVCRVYDVGQSGDLHFITMALVAGESLEKRLALSALTPQMARQVLLQICEALRAAHAQGVVHRDLKPGNIMIDDAGRITVLDFGLARDLHGERSVSGMMIGSPAYWSPEQARGHHATEHSDIYALGVIGCELFGAPRPPLGAKPDLGAVPPALRGVLERCLQTEPRARFPSIAALEQALRKARPRRVRIWIAAAVGVLAVAGGLIVVIARQSQPAEEARRASIKARAVAPAVPADATVATPVHPDRGAVAERRLAKATVRPRTASKRVKPDLSLAHKVSIADAGAQRGVNDVRLAQLQARAAALEAQRRRLGLLVDDMPSYRAKRQATHRALASKDLVAAERALEQQQQTLGTTRVDRTFVGQKLKRLNQLLEQRSLKKEAAQQVRASFAQVHARYFAGDFAAANGHLNAIWAALRKAAR